MNDTITEKRHGMTSNKLTITVDLDITDAALNKCLRVLEIWLEMRTVWQAMQEARRTVRHAQTHAYSGSPEPYAGGRAA